ncbi:MAG: alpha/beta hydrolase family protein, partial [Armatimonadota bacterium]
MLEVKDVLARTFVNTSELMLQVQRLLEPLIKAPVIALPQTNEGQQWWQKKATQMRKTLLERVVLSGVPQQWQQTPLKVEWLDTLPGNGYRIRKLRYQAVPDLWIPALLYEPVRVKPSTPAVLYLMGHEGRGKSAVYAQTFCINMAKRGIYALNPEWFGFGQLAHPELVHGCMNQLDLCGVRGVSVFYLSLKRALDVLLSLPNVDSKRIGVTGLSGGGWQTIFISALDERVTLANPVAGYSSFLTRLHHLKDLGDSEQTPCDMACFADYTDLTMLVAPRPLLLTFCAYDDCCFEAGYALPPLLRAAQRVYQMLDAEEALAWHVNYNPGTHNYERDNREAFYRFIHRHWFLDDPQFDPTEIPCDGELRSAEELAVPLPPDNATFNKLAKTLSRSLPTIALPQDEKASAQQKQQLAEQILRVVVPESYRVWAIPFGSERHGDWQVTFWQLCVGNESGQISLPATEIQGSEDPVGPTVVITADGRTNAAEPVRRWLARK